jgi:hypothetical protein
MVVEESRLCEDGRLLSLGHVCVVGGRRDGMEQLRRWWLGHACIIICPQTAAGSRIGVSLSACASSFCDGAAREWCNGGHKVRNASTVAGGSFVRRPHSSLGSDDRGIDQGADGRRGWGWQRICIWTWRAILDHPPPSCARLHASSELSLQRKRAGQALRACGQGGAIGWRARGVG